MLDLVRPLKVCAPSISSRGRAYSTASLSLNICRARAHARPQPPTHMSACAHGRTHCTASHPSVAGRLSSLAAAPVLPDGLALRPTLRRGAPSGCGGACVAGGPLSLAYRPTPRPFHLMCRPCHPARWPSRSACRTCRPARRPSRHDRRLHRPVRRPFFCERLTRGAQEVGGGAGAAAKARAAGGEEPRAHGGEEAGGVSHARAIARHVEGGSNDSHDRRRRGGRRRPGPRHRPLHVS